MGIQREIWQGFMDDRLWKDNEFLKFANNEDQYVLAGKVVHIPTPGAKPTTVKNRSSFPAAAVKRNDVDLTYVLDEYTTDPAHIPDADKVELAYSKIESVWGDHVGQLVETIGDDMIIKWLDSIPSTNIIRTSGADSGLYLETGQTGTRKIMTPKDLQNAKLKMNKMNVPKRDRYALLEDNMADQLFDALSISGNRDFSEYADAANGIVGKLHGFFIMTRSSVAMASNADVIKALGSSNAATDNVASMCWQKDAVARAIGEKKIFDAENDPTYYGDIYSGLMRAGGRRRRANAEGVVAIIQAPGA